MKPTTGLYLMMAIMHFIWLTNTTLLDNEWTNISLFLSTGLFVGGTAFYLGNRKKKDTKK